MLADERFTNRVLVAIGENLVLSSKMTDRLPPILTAGLKREGNELRVEFACHEAGTANLVPTASARNSNSIVDYRPSKTLRRSNLVVKGERPLMPGGECGTSAAAKDRFIRAAILDREVCTAPAS